MKNSKKYLTITGIKHYFGKEIFKVGQILYLQKEPENPYDGEAIKVLLGDKIKVGYVANSTYTVVNGTRSAGRLYDKIKNGQQIKVKFIANDCVIAKLR